MDCLFCGRQTLPREYYGGVRMAVKIRLTRVGAKNRPAYRLVVADSRSPVGGRFIEIIGHYNPRTEPPTLKVNEERALDWLRKGAIPSDTARALLVKAGVMARFEGGTGNNNKGTPVAAEEA